MYHFRKHYHHYFPLMTIFIAGVVGFIFFSYDRIFQIALATSLSAAYFSWGIIHHKIHKDLDMFVIVEYLSISLLGLIMLLSLIYRS